MSVILVLLSISSVFAVVYFEYEDFTYYIDDDEAIISEYTGTSTSIDVPNSIGNDPIRAIGFSAFSDMTTITSVSLPDSLYYIYPSAFKGMTSLTEITIPKYCRNIAISAFQNCDSLTSVTFNTDLLSSINAQTFRNCTSLQSIAIPDNVTLIGAYAFQNCSSLRNVIIPQSVTSISSTAFDGCNNLTITCYDNSCAMQYAIDNGIDYDVIDPLKGDFDGDGVVTVNDATYIQMNDVGMSIPFTVDKHALKRGEVTGDGEVDVRDATMVQMKLANMISSFD